MMTFADCPMCFGITISPLAVCDFCGEAGCCNCIDIVWEKSWVCKKCKGKAVTQFWPEHLKPDDYFVNGFGYRRILKHSEIQELFYLLKIPEDKSEELPKKEVSGIDLGEPFSVIVAYSPGKGKKMRVYIDGGEIRMEVKDE